MVDVRKWKEHRDDLATSGWTRANKAAAEGRGRCQTSSAAEGNDEPEHSDAT